MARASKQVELTIVYEPAEGGRMTARVPAVPGAISVGRTRSDARTHVIDALGELLSVTPELASVPGQTQERVQVELQLGRVLDHGHDRSL